MVKSNGRLCSGVEAVGTAFSGLLAPTSEPHQTSGNATAAGHQPYTCVNNGYVIVDRRAQRDLHQYSLETDAASLKH